MLGGVRGELLGGRGRALAAPVVVRAGKVASTLASGRLLVAAWLLGAATLGAGILIGWAIWS
jgi:hypothetical protein